MVHTAERSVLAWKWEHLNGLEGAFKMGHLWCTFLLSVNLPVCWARLECKPFAWFIMSLWPLHILFGVNFLEMKKSIVTLSNFCVLKFQVFWSIIFKLWFSFSLSFSFFFDLSLFPLSYFRAMHIIITWNVSYTTC